MFAPENARRPGEILKGAGVDLDLRWRETGHGLTYTEVAEAKERLSRVLAGL
jgi:phospholipase/carboxylesterase